MLTISIPTYNRPEQLKKTLRLLLPQMTKDCFLMIQDNCSDIPVEQYVLPIISEYPDLKFKITRNQVNIGGDANIIRCFELCESDWLWTLGDDDEIKPNAIEIIFADIKKYPDAVLINYVSPSGNRPDRTNTTLSYGRAEFLKNIDSFGAIMYISCNVQNTKYLKSTHHLANNNTYSCVTQWLVVFYALQPDSLTVISDTIICLNPVVVVGNESANINVIQGISTLLDMRIPYEEKKLLLSCLKRDMHNLVSVESLLRTVTMQYMSTKDRNYIFLFNRLYHTYFRHFGLKIKLKYNFYSLLLTLSPSFTFGMIRQLYLKKRGIDISNFVKSNK